MESLSLLGLLAGSSWASGINLYLTVAALGIANRMDWLTLPSSLETLSHPLVILSALIFYAIEFFADKVPYIDSAWDSIHTFIRPAGAFLIGYLATSEMGPVIQTITSLATGTIALDSHLTKATSRAMINTSPEPFTNSIASVTEDVSVVGVLYLIIHHPVIITLLVILFILFSIWFLRKMWRFVRKIFQRNSQPIARADSASLQQKAN